MIRIGYTSINANWYFEPAVILCNHCWLNTELPVMLHRHCRIFALLAYKYEVGKDILEHAEAIAQLLTSLLQVHEYLKIETGKKEQKNIWI
jgi:hypothetical protein